MYCQICGKGNAEKHHIIFKSQGGKNFLLNYKYLCPDHHRGNISPHKNKQIDIEYKEELQKELEELLTKDHYRLEELINLLGMQKVEAKKTFKHLKQYTEGYNNREIVFRLLGDKFYA
ncbi:HNH endonuclease [Alkaliphilus sp. B6464]|uniref:HNH endonuclease n=1 Tax=Alkaliphilus sp. B6464 TaxID=2731219 RepID=UPI001BA88B0D|nr:HNH endonuclease [Alkaliphilus sp. B6464]QUH21094.1 HNH endonuclease [Alkaliphilus sp. B6464]